MTGLAGEQPDDERVALSRLRRRIGANMVKSLATSPHVTLSVDIDYNSVSSIRQEFGPLWQAAYGCPLTFLPFVARRACEALRQFRDLNASIDGTDLIRRSSVNLGVAVDLDGEGLVVPVIHGAEALVLSELSIAAHKLGAAAAQRGLTPDDVQGGTFTITSPGRAGADRSTPIILQPQVAILAIDAIRIRPAVVAGGSLAAHPVGALSLSFDHRAVDGVYASGFLHAVRTALESETAVSAGIDFPREVV